MKKRMNLYAQYLADEKKGRSVSGWINGLVVLLVVALIMGAFGIKLFIDKVNLASDISRLESFVANENNINRVNEVDAIIKENGELSKLKSSIGEINSIFDAKSTLSSGILNDIEMARPLLTTLESLNINGGSASLVFSSRDPRAGSKFVSNLKDCSNIQDVIYNGYIFDEASLIYRGTINLVLKGDF
jgi:hypothetical protein